MEARTEIEVAQVFADAARRHGALFAVNDRADVAYAVQPDVLHLGQDDLPVDVVRDLLGDEVLIGRSTHAAAEAELASSEPGVDYFCVGPTWPTPTKPGRPAPGLPLVAHAARLGSDRPWFAIGGIDENTVDQVLAAGARRIVVVRAITDAEDPGAAAASLARRLRA
jgi:thiamine-phosphate pyrophosphorylase